MTAGRTLIFVTTGLTYGGAETQFVRVVLGLRRRGWPVAVISLLPPVALSEALSADGVPVHCLGMVRGKADPRALLRAIRLLRQYRPAVGVSFQYHANLLLRLASAAAGTQAVVSSIRNEYFGGPLRDCCLRVTDRMASLTVTNSYRARAALVKRNVVPARRLVVIPNGIDLSRFHHRSAAEHAAARTSLGIRPESFVWLSIGRLEAQKRIDRLLTAFGTVVAADPRARLLICGQGSLREHLQQQAVSLGVAEKVEFVGTRADVRPLLAAADAQVLSSDHEGLPNVLLEAHAAGLPVVATDVGGVAEIVTEGVSGLLTAERTPEALSEKMLDLMALGGDRLREMGARGRRHVSATFQLEPVIERWHTTLIALAARTAGPGGYR